MSKPNWDDAPDWANWVAMDRGGHWYWHAGEPFWDSYDGAWYDNDFDDEITLLACSDMSEIDPSSTLEGRP
jgi:hypothetical protein